MHTLISKHCLQFKANITHIIMQTLQLDQSGLFLIDWCWIFTKLSQTNTHCFTRHCIAINIACHVAMGGAAKRRHTQNRAPLYICVNYYIYTHSLNDYVKAWQSLQRQGLMTWLA